MKAIVVTRILPRESSLRLEDTFLIKILQDGVDEIKSSKGILVNKRAPEIPYREMDPGICRASKFC